MYIRDSDLGAIDAWLDGNYVKVEPGLAHRWIDKKTESPVLYIETARIEELYQDPDDLMIIEKRLGAPIATLIVVEVSGKCPGRSELVQFLKNVMSKFSCVVQDEETSYPWNMEELDHLNSEGRLFFNF